MASTNERGLLRRAEERLDGWTFTARDHAYAELFDGENAVLTDEELRLVDRIDPDLARGTGDGLWDTDEYGIVVTDAETDGTPRVVCSSHPAIPYEGYRGAESLDESTREELNDALWDSCERVASLVQADLEAFLRSSRREQ